MTTEVLVDETVYSQGFGEAWPAVDSLTVRVVGPEVELLEPANVTVCIDGEWAVRMSDSAALKWSVSLGGEPVNREGESFRKASLDMSHCETVALPSGVTTLRATIAVAAFDSSGQPAGVIQSHAAAMHWRVTR